ncbi:MAG TPA: hypothetical protein VOA87_06540 [Thermoanaerobaculia bacterium]|nr:hypothetical protein [Thermoanaerobaculia bacterium]
MRNPRSSTVFTLLAVLALLAAVPLAAYTIVLKDGSTLAAKEKYKISGTRALITLQNGTQTFLDAKQIDVAKTEEVNQHDYGNAVVIDDTRANAAAAPPAAPRKRTLADLIETRKTAPRDVPEARRESRRGESGGSGGGAGRTKAGYVDFSTVARKPFAQLEVASDLQQFLHAQGIEEVEIYQGSEPDRPLVEITTNSEGAVFKALAVGANALLHIRDSHPKVAALDLLMTTPAKERAGQFVLTPQNAADLVAKNVEIAAFYLTNVQF